MPRVKAEEISVQSEDLHAIYSAYKLRTAQNYIYMLAIVVSVLNLLLIVYDINCIETQTARLITAAVRYVYSVLLILVSGWLTRTSDYREYAISVSIMELGFVVINLYVLSQYTTPNFLIHSMGTIATMLVVFLVPNRKDLQLTLAVVAAVSFYTYCFINLKVNSVSDITASVTYSVMAIIICTISNSISEKNRLREFVAKNRLEQMSTMDFLTNTANRFRLEEEADRWMSFCRRQKLPLCLVFVDVDNLKQMNDTFGHAAGDSVLITLAHLMQSQLRNSDTIARWGGDEFVLLLPNVSLKNAVTLLERLKSAVSTANFGEKIQVTCSYGVVEMDETSSFQSLLRKADALMYTGKRDGRNRIRYLSQSEGDAVES